jgi:hypothetical protein
MRARIGAKEMGGHRHGRERRDRRGGGDGQGLDHPGLPGLKDRSRREWRCAGARSFAGRVARFAWRGAWPARHRLCPASPTSTASLSGREFNSLSSLAMNAFCVALARLRGTASGLGPARRRCARDLCRAWRTPSGARGEAILAFSGLLPKPTHGRKKRAKALTYSDNSGRRRPPAEPNRCFVPDP